MHTDGLVAAVGSEVLRELGRGSGTVEDDMGRTTSSLSGHGNNGGCESREDGNNGELHFDCWWWVGWLTGFGLK